MRSNPTKCLFDPYMIYTFHYAISHEKYQTLLRRKTIPCQIKNLYLRLNVVPIDNIYLIINRKLLLYNI